MFRTNRDDNEEIATTGGMEDDDEEEQQQQGKEDEKEVEDYVIEEFSRGIEDDDEEEEQQQGKEDEKEVDSVEGEEDGGEDYIPCCIRCGEIPCPWLECREAVLEHVEGLEDMDIAADQKRFQLYKLCTTILFGYLGKNNRVPLPQCVLLEIRRMYPSNDGSYVGFQDANISK